MKSGKNLLLPLILVLLLIPFLQSMTLLFPETKLNGFVLLNPRPDLKRFSWHRWFDGSFQEDYSKRREDHIGLRNTLFRLHNQYDFSLFGITHAQGFIKGREGNLFEEDYIHEYTGNYFIGKKVWEKKLWKLKQISDDLKSLHVDLIPVIEPGKASFYPELIPSRFHPGNRNLSNHDFTLYLFDQMGIEYLDLNRYFLNMKDTSRYPLFPKYGMHWSIYGVTLAVDTLIKYIEKVRNTDLPGFKIDGIDLSDSLRYTDNDIGNMLNLIFPLPKVKAAYPRITFEYAPGKKRLKVLVIADSYYLNIVNGFADQIFGKEEYWYYNSKVYPAIIDNENPVYVDKSDLRKKLQEFDVILLMTSEINMHCGYWNFIDEVYHAFHPDKIESKVYDIENRIRNQREWFRFMFNKSRNQGITLERSIRMDAEYSFYNDYESLSDKNSEDSIAHLAISIKKDPGWLKQIGEKARSRNLPLEEMIDQDARYLYSTSKKK
ncbi:MAG: hypothetical protein WCL00_06810 [Bacteroidota bacterium]